MLQRENLHLIIQCGLYMSKIYLNFKINLVLLIISLAQFTSNYPKIMVVRLSI